MEELMRTGYLLPLVLFMGCAMGGLRPGEPSFSARKIQHVKTVKATTTWWSIFCFIPLDFDPKYHVTMKKLHKEAALRRNEALVNLRVDRLPMVLLLACRYKLTLSADVISLDPSASRADDAGDDRGDDDDDGADRGGGGGGGRGGGGGGRGGGGYGSDPAPLQSPCQTHCQQGFGECMKQCSPSQPACSRYCEQNRNRCLLRCRQ
jgi:hypothetical protein